MKTKILLQLSAKIVTTSIGIGLTLFNSATYAVTPRHNPSKHYIHNFHTIGSLASLTDEQLFNLIKEKAVTEECVPNGESAGIPGRMDKNVIQNQNFIKVLFNGLFNLFGNDKSEFVASQVWKGKVFQRDTMNCSRGTGINRILGSHYITLTNKIIPLDEYAADLQRFIDRNESYFVQAMEKSKNKINLVELNYANPSKDPFHAGKLFGVRDIMVPIQGKYGVIYIGRAYTGEWTSETQFKSSGLVAWFFLDFSPQAVEDQSKRPF